MKAPARSHQKAGSARRRILILLFFVLIIAGGSLAVMAFTDLGRPSQVMASAPPPTERELLRIAAPGKIDTARTSSYDVLEQMRAMDQSSRSSLPRDLRSGHVEAGPLLSSGKRDQNKWTITSAHKTLMASPSISNGRLFVPGGFGSKVYYAFDLGTGKPIWTANLDDDGPSSAVCTDSLIVFNTESCTLFVLDQRTGRMVWSRWLGDPLMSTPMVANGRVFTSYPHAGSSSSSSRPKNDDFMPTHPFACFDLLKGTLLWQTWLDGDVLSTSVEHDGAIYLTTFPGTLYKLDEANGQIEAAMAIKATSVPAIMGEEIFITKRADQDKAVMENIAVLDLGTLGFLREFHSRTAPYLDHAVQERSQFKTYAMAFDAGNGFGEGAPANSGVEKARMNVGASNVSSLQSFMGSTIIAFDGSLYTVMGDSLLCLEPDAGKIQWSFKIEADMKTLGGTAATAPIVSDAYVATATVTGRVIVCDRRTGELTFDLDAGKSVRYPPIMDQGWLYVPTTEGELVAFNTHDAKVHHWPMLMRSAEHLCDR